MSGSEPPSRGTVLLRVEAENPATRLTLFDHELHAVDGGRGTGALELAVPRGLYLLRSQLATALEEQFLSLGAEGNLHTVRVPALKIDSPAPLERAGPLGPRHQQCARKLSQEVQASLGQGSGLFLFTSAPGGSELLPSHGLTLLDVQGRELKRFAGLFRHTDPTPEGPWSACTVELAPGPYRLRFEAGTRSAEQLLIVSPGWQTQVFVRAHPEESPLTLHGGVAIFMGRERFEPANPDVYLTEVLRLELAEQRLTLNARELLARALRSGTLDPMLGLYCAAHALLLEPEQERGLLQEVLATLRGQLSDEHPDVRALAAALGEDVAPFPFPPMLESSWDLLVEASQRRPELIPLGSLSARVATARLEGGPWLLWSPRWESAREDVALSPMEAMALSQVPEEKPAPSRLPVWVKRKEPLAKLSGTELARTLHLPPTVAEEMVEGLRAKQERARQERAARRHALLSDEKAPLCLVIIPEGVRDDPTGQPPIDFDALYEQGVEPALLEAGIAPVRVSPELALVELWRVEPLVFACVLLELTLQDPKSFYLLGWLGPGFPKLVLCAEGHGPLNLAPFQTSCIPYPLGPSNQFDKAQAQVLRDRLEQPLREARAASEPPSDDPRPFAEYRQPFLAGHELREQLAEARGREDGGERLRQLEQEQPSFDEVETSALVALFLSYRRFNAWDDMIRVAERLPKPLQQWVLVREQWAFALNRRAQKQLMTPDREKAISLLDSIESELGPNSETCGILGRIYKDLWEEAQDKGGELETLAASSLDKAIATYLRGFQANTRDFYPGINALTLLEARGDADSIDQKDRWLPLVRIAVEQRLRGTRSDYWGIATMLELAVLEDDEQLAERYLTAALASVRESYEPETTARNLRLISKARARRGEQTGWLHRMLERLDSRPP
ncbi:TRAFs-binding domain-containing protein [Archangium sp.]|uniref:TRAFs-binding domain-containing protein n=1 Tax=Archangium sp. TaxID=1872627 RepID=UPI00286B3538|nr:TRAFs-binding domain-containing protein [Archangium sp.]